MNITELIAILAWCGVVAWYFTYGAAEGAGKKSAVILGAAAVAFLAVLVF